MSDFKYVGKSYIKEDAYSKAKGRTKYICDMKKVDMLYAKLVLSQRANSAFTIDKAKSLEIPGIVAVYTHEDVPKVKYNAHNWYKGSGGVEDQYILSEKARYVGDHIGLVVGETKEAVEEAVSLLSIDYIEKEPIIGIEQAMEDDRNIAFEKTIVCGDYETFNEEADMIIRSKGTTPKIHHGAIESHIVLSEFDEMENLVVWSPCQTVHQIQYHISHLLGLPFSRIRVIKAIMGGSFGGKGQTVIEPACAFATYTLKRPVKLYMSREDTIQATRSRNAMSIEVETAVTKSGKILGRKILNNIDGGAYHTNASAIGMAFGKKLFRMYHIPNQSCDLRTYYTNTIPGGACRGYGSPQAHAITEVNLDFVSRELGMDPCELRLRNFAEPMAEDPTGGTNLGNMQIETCVRQGMEVFDWENRRNQVRCMETDRYAYGVGMACAAHGNGYKGAYPDFTNVTMIIYPDSSVMVKVGVHDQGCGTLMVMQQIAAEALGMDPYQVKVQEADTFITPYDSAGTQASRVTYVCGRAVQKAGEALNEKLIQACVRLYGWKAEEIQAREGTVIYGDLAMTYGEVALAYEKQCARTMSVNLEYEPPTNPGSYACAFAEVRVDKYTGLVDVTDLLCVHDIGQAMNRQQVEGQVAGGAHMSLGMALYEAIEFDGSGRVRNTNFSKYHMINAPIMPRVKTLLVEAGEPHGPYGGKSVGELAAVGPGPAVINAVNHALGSSFIDYPLTPEKVVAYLVAIEGRECLE